MRILYKCRVEAKVSKKCLTSKPHEPRQHAFLHFAVSQLSDCLLLHTCQIKFLPQRVPLIQSVHIGVCIRNVCMQGLLPFCFFFFTLHDARVRCSYIVRPCAEVIAIAPHLHQVGCHFLKFIFLRFNKCVPRNLEREQGVYVAGLFHLVATNWKAHEIGAAILPFAVTWQGTNAAAPLSLSERWRQST